MSFACKIVTGGRETFNIVIPANYISFSGISTMTINVFHRTVKVLIGDEDDYNIEGSHLAFGVSANSTNCVEDEEQCFSFTAVQDSIKEEEEKFKLYLSTGVPGIRFYRVQGHISILKDLADGMRVWLLHKCALCIYCLLIDPQFCLISAFHSHIYFGQWMGKCG